MTALDDDGYETRATPVHGYALPPFPTRYVPPFNGRGQYRLPDPVTGKLTAYTRVSTLAETIADHFHLDKWRRRMVVRGLVEGGVRVESGEPLSDERANRIAEEAMTAAGAAQAAEFGTAVHAWLEAVDTGKVAVPALPEEYRDHGREYLHALTRHAVEPVPEYCERIVYHAETNTVGTLDRIYRLPDGTLAVGDVKTSRTLDFAYLSYAAQVALYASADFMLTPDGGAWEPMPTVRQDYAVLAHVPSSTPEHAALIPFDIAAGQTYYRLALQVRRARAQAAKDVPFRHALPIPTPEHVALAAARSDVLSATTTEELSSAWERHRAVWHDGLTRLGHSVLGNHNHEGTLL